MGTRSLTFVHDSDDAKSPILCLYRQFDGYFSAAGEDILNFLKGSTIVNGFGGDAGTVFNGSGDLAVRLVTHLKNLNGRENEPGNFYIEAPDLADGDMGTEFAYHIYCTIGQPPLLVATDTYAQHTEQGPVDTFVFPTPDGNGGYVEGPDNSGPLREDQRKALFASFSDVFSDSDQSTRLAFTRLVLGKSHDEAVSWSTWKPGALTVRQASKVLDALADLGGGGVG